MWGHVPEARHKLREAALYVDITPAGNWNRPVTEISQEQARVFLENAANDYGLQRSQRYYELDLIEAKDPELYEALTQWEGRPELPEPEWPPIAP